MDNSDSTFVVATTIYRGMGGRDFDTPEAIYGPADSERAEKLAHLLNREGCWGVFETSAGDWDDRLLWPEQVNRWANREESDEANWGQADVALAEAHDACCHWAERLDLRRVPREAVAWFVYRHEQWCPSETPEGEQPDPVPVWRAASRELAGQVADAMNEAFRSSSDEWIDVVSSWHWEAAEVRGAGRVAVVAEKAESNGVAPFVVTHGGYGAGHFDTFVTNGDAAECEHIADLIRQEFCRQVQMDTCDVRLDGDAAEVKHAPDHEPCAAHALYPDADDTADNPADTSRDAALKAHHREQEDALHAMDAEQVEAVRRETIQTTPLADAAAEWADYLKASAYPFRPGAADVGDVTGLAQQAGQTLLRMVRGIRRVEGAQPMDPTAFNLACNDAMNHVAEHLRRPIGHGQPQHASTDLNTVVDWWEWDTSKVQQRTAVVELDDPWAVRHLHREAWARACAVAAGGVSVAVGSLSVSSGTVGVLRVLRQLVLELQTFQNNVLANPIVRDELWDAFEKRWATLAVEAAIQRLAGMVQAERVQLQAMLTPLAAAAPAAADRDPLDPDGQCRPPKKFERQGVIVDLQPTPYRLLASLWDAPRRTLTDQAVVDAVWGGDEKTGAIRAAVSKLNTALLTVGIVVRRSDGYIVAEVDPMPRQATNGHREANAAHRKAG